MAAASMIMSSQKMLMSSKLRAGGAHLNMVPSRRVLDVRCEGSKGPSPGGIREAVDRATKKTLTKDDIVRHQDHDESEKKSVMGVKPSAGSVFGRPEVDRRPETGSHSFYNVFAFDGALPETVNARLAMVGITWAFLAELTTGFTVWEQLTLPGNTGLIFFLGAVQLLTYASIVPILNSESSDARSFGPFTAKAERWNGRLAMIGFSSLLIVESFTHAPVFHWPGF